MFLDGRQPRVKTLTSFKFDVCPPSAERCITIAADCRLPNRSCHEVILRMKLNCSWRSGLLPMAKEIGLGAAVNPRESARDPRAVALRHAEAYPAASAVNGGPETVALVDRCVKVFEKAFNRMQDLRLSAVDMANELDPEHRRQRERLRKPVNPPPIALFSLGHDPQFMNSAAAVAAPPSSIEPASQTFHCSGVVSSTGIALA